MGEAGRRGVFHLSAPVGRRLQDGQGRRLNRDFYRRGRLGFSFLSGQMSSSKCMVDFSTRFVAREIGALATGICFFPRQSRIKIFHKK
jgi:hypothetical protein